MEEELCHTEFCKLAGRLIKIFPNISKILVDMPLKATMLETTDILGEVLFRSWSVRSGSRTTLSSSKRGIAPNHSHLQHSSWIPSSLTDRSAGAWGTAQTFIGFLISNRIKFGKDWKLMQSLSLKSAVRQVDFICTKMICNVKK